VTTVADYAELPCEVSCPACGAAVGLPDGRLRFQWGRVPHRYERAPAPLAWILSPDGEPAPAYEAADEAPGAPWNAGQPEKGTVYAFDDDPRLAGLACPRCAAAVERVAARIEGGALVGAAAFPAGELARKVSARPGSYSAVVVKEDGTWAPHPDWEAREADAPVREDV
jgi:hypothetical protein